MMNATQYEFDVDPDATVGTVMFTILISVEDPNIAKRFSLSLYNEDDFLAFNQTDELKGYFNLTANIGNDFEYDNHTMLYNIPVNLVLHTPFDPNDDVTTHMTKLNMKYVHRQ